MKILIIFSLLIFSTFAYIERCPKCDDGAVQTECFCRAFKKAIELTNGTTLYCCGKQIKVKCGGFWEFLKWLIERNVDDGVRDYDNYNRVINNGGITTLAPVDNPANENVVVEI